MNDSTKQNLDEIAADLAKVRKNNAPTYWLMLVCGGVFATGLLTIIFKTTGITLLVTAAFVYIMNNLLNAWLEIRKAEKSVEEAARRAKEKVIKKAASPIPPKE
jgi:hypothetical protein